MSKGFTLIELMIVVAVIGILAMIAFPSYGQYVLRSNRTVGKTMLMKIAGQQESFFTDRKSYATTLTALSSTLYPADPVYALRDTNVSAMTTSEAIYRVSLTSDGSTFTVTAEPVNAQTKDTKCGTLTLASSGAKNASGSDGAKCWR